MRDKECNATIDILFKKINRNTIKNDELSKSGFNVCIKIKFHHSHRVNVAEAYSYLRIAPNIRETFFQYFNEGMTCASARNYHELLIQNTQVVEEPKLTMALANAQSNPTERQVRHLFDIWRFTNFGGRDQLSMLDVLKKKSVQYKESGMAKISIRENPLIVVILTPIMLRAHKEWFSSEVVFVDSSGSCDQTNTCVTFMFSASKIGAIPLACILHTAQTEANYSLAFSLLKESLPEDSFGNAPYPQVFMTDDSAAERNALISVFSVSEYERPILYLCIFHVCQAFWRWLWDSHNNILKENRRYVMKLFQNIMYALTVEEANGYFNEFMKDNVVQKYDNLKTHVSKFWLRKEEWYLCFKKNVMSRGNNTNNFVESSIRIFKDIVLQRCKAFNMCALVDFIVNVFESCHKRHILSFANNRSTKNNTLYMKFCQKIQNMNVQKINNYMYSVSSNADQSLIYTVDIDLAMCDCVFGSSGKFCKHLCAVQERCGIVFKNAPLLTSNDKKCLLS